MTIEDAGRNISTCLGFSTAWKKIPKTSIIIETHEKKKFRKTQEKVVKYERMKTKQAFIYACILKGRRQRRRVDCEMWFPVSCRTTYQRKKFIGLQISTTKHF